MLALTVKFTVLCSWQRCNQCEYDSYCPPPLASCCRGTEELPGPADGVWAGGDHGLRRDLVPRSGLSEDRGIPRNAAKLWIWRRARKLRQGNVLDVYRFNHVKSHFRLFHTFPDHIDQHLPSRVVLLTIVCCQKTKHKHYTYELIKSLLSRD